MSQSHSLKLVIHLDIKSASEWPKPLNTETLQYTKSTLAVSGGALSVDKLAGGICTLLEKEDSSLF